MCVLTLKAGRGRLSITADLCYSLDFVCLHPSDHPAELNEVLQCFPFFNCIRLSFTLLESEGEEVLVGVVLMAAQASSH